MTNQKIIENILIVIAILLIIVTLTIIKNPIILGYATNVKYIEYKNTTIFENNSNNTVFNIDFNFYKLKENIHTINKNSLYDFKNKKETLLNKIL